MGLLKNVQKMNMTANNSNEAILNHIASGKKYLVHEMIGSTVGIEHVLNLFYDNGYVLKTITAAGLDVESMNRNAITLVFEKV